MIHARSFALALVAGFVPLAAGAGTGPTQGAQPHPSDNHVHPSPSPSPPLCTMAFSFAASTAGPAGATTAVSAQQYRIASYRLKPSLAVLGGGTATVITNPDVAATLGDLETRHVSIQRVAFACPATSASIANATVATLVTSQQHGGEPPPVLTVTFDYRTNELPLHAR